MHLKLAQNANRGYHLQLPLDAAMKRQSIQLPDAFICVSSCQSVINMSFITTSEAGQDLDGVAGRWVAATGCDRLVMLATLMLFIIDAHYFKLINFYFSGEEASDHHHHSPRSNCCSVMKACGSCRTESSRLRNGWYCLLLAWRVSPLSRRTLLESIFHDTASPVWSAVVRFIQG